MKDVLSIEKPLNTGLLAPVVFDSPHSGSLYPADFHYACARHDLERVEDRYVGELFSAAPDCGAAFLQAHFPRSYIDVNRAPDDIHPDILSKPWPAAAHGSLAPSRFSYHGIGLVFHNLHPDIDIYDGKIAPSEILTRLEKCYIPYHAALKSLLDEAHDAFGEVWHINCHSMPSTAAQVVRPFALLGSPVKGVDIVLGDRGGSTASRDFVHAVRHFFRTAGYTVSINDPYQGAELIRRYSQPTRGRHSLQIEINRALYMDETHLTKTDNFIALKGDLTKFIDFTVDYAHSHTKSLAAE